MPRLLPLAFALLGLAACAGSPTTGWNKPATPPEQWRLDEAQCRSEASNVPTPAGGWASYDADRILELSFASCLRNLGYRSVALTDAQLSALSVASYPQRKRFEERFAIAPRPETVKPLDGS